MDHLRRIQNYIDRHDNWRKLAKSHKYTGRTFLAAIAADLFHSIGQYTATELYADYSQPIAVDHTPDVCLSFSNSSKILTYKRGDRTYSRECPGTYAISLFTVGEYAVMCTFTSCTIFTQKCELVHEYTFVQCKSRMQPNLERITQHGDGSSTITNLLTGDEERPSYVVSKSHRGMHMQTNPSSLEPPYTYPIMYRGWIIGKHADYTPLYSAASYPMFSAKRGCIHIVNPYTGAKLGAVLCRDVGTFVELPGRLYIASDTQQAYIFPIRSRPYLRPSKRELVAGTQCSIHKFRNGQCKYCPAKM